MDDLILDFITETNESLGTLDVELIKLEQDPNDKEILSNIFRLMHTIKGTCGFLGLPRLENIAHAGENVLGKIRDGELDATSDIISLVLEVLDRIRMIMVSLEENQAEPEGDDDDLKGRLKAAADAGPDASAEEGGAEGVPEDIPPPEPAGDLEGESDASDQDAADLTAEKESLPGAAAAAQEAPAAGALPRKPEAGGKPSAPKAPGSSNQSIRVNVGLLESLMTMVSELVLTRNQLLQLTRNQVGASADFSAPLQRLNQVVSELQEGVMKTRMQPIENAWSKLPRLVRDISRDLGKKINLEMKGAETELDRQVLEMIRDPLTHMVRNSADHGVETPDERVAGGKSETGTITLNAYHEGGHIIIQIIDDGKGVNLQRVTEKALANGLTTEEQLAGMSDQQICQFIFKPGFSTAQQVTSVSGRGVGMDVVRSNIEKIGGHVEISSQAGKGSCFTIKIPLTLAIVPALIVESCSTRFAIPQIAVKELVRISQNDNNHIEYIDGAPVLRLRDTILPLVRLREVLQLDAESEEAERFIVITRVGTFSFGMLVDRILDTEEIVVKPVSALIKDITAFSGNTILGDGSVVMILDPNGIASSVSDVNINALQNDSEQALTANDTEKMTLLLFKAGDDAPKAIPLSLVTRLEEVEREQIELVNGRHMVQYRGALMPLVAVHQQQVIGDQAKTPVIVFSSGERSIGLVVDSILDIVTSSMAINVSNASSSSIGTATILDRATEIIDASYFMQAAFPEWIDQSLEQDIGRPRKRILLIDDHAFFPDLLRPHAIAAGMRFHATNSLEEARSLSEKNDFTHLLVSVDLMNSPEGMNQVAEIRSLLPDGFLVAITRDPALYSDDFHAQFSRRDLAPLVSWLKAG